MRHILSLLPRSIRYQIFRKKLSLPKSLPDNMTLSLAETQSDFYQAFRILHDSYVREGFMAQHPSKLRVTPYHLLKSTTTYIAKFEGQVVATISMVRDSSFGLPMDQIFDLKALRANGQRIGEVSALAVHPDFRGQGGLLLFCLLRFIWIHSMERHQLDHVVISVNPSRADLYRGICAFQELPKSRVDNYSFVQGAPAVGLKLNLKNSRQILGSVYRGQPSKSNFHKFLFENEAVRDLPMDRSNYYSLFHQDQMTPELRKYFLKECTNVWNEMTPDQQKQMAATFDLRDPEKLFSSHLEPTDYDRSPRRDVYCPIKNIATSTSINSSSHLGVLQDASATGFKIVLNPSINLYSGQEIDLKVAIGPHQDSKLTALGQWKSGSVMGLEILKADSSWFDLFGTQRQPARLRLVG